MVWRGPSATRYLLSALCLVCEWCRRPAVVLSSDFAGWDDSRYATTGLPKFGGLAALGWPPVRAWDGILTRWGQGVQGPAWAAWAAWTAWAAWALGGRGVAAVRILARFVHLDLESPGPERPIITTIISVHPVVASRLAGLGEK